ncbi:MAG: Radical superfamily protein [Deltaproteobacteria bacterium]|nr:Radical superfamily protein [Deltaproteobacteria bacterium]
MLAVKETQAKSILNKSQIFDYCVNPYTGCQVNCRYCYARLFMKRYSGHKEAWGEFVDVKINAPEVLRKQLQRAKRGTAWISSVCDPYQPLEAKYELTRRCLKELLEKQFPVNIQTKSKLVLRDMDLLKDFKEIEVGFTITTNDEKIAGFFEPGAASVADRMKALERIHSSGIKTFAFIGPLLPGDPEKLVAALDGSVDRVFIDRMNYLSQIKSFYRQLNLEWATEDEFFQEYKARLTSELKKRGMKFEAVF